MSGSPETPYPGYYATVAPKPPDGPIDVERMVGDRRPVELELGFGRGSFLLERGAVRPDGALIGIEIKSKWAYRVSERRERMGLSHVSVWAGDAREILPRMAPEACLDRCFMHFPDPWWKKRHAGRRLVDSDLLDQLARLLRPQGELFIQTDVQERAIQYRERIQTHPGFRLEGDGWLDHNPYEARSNRERRAIEDGLPIHRLLARRHH